MSTARLRTALSIEAMPGGGRDCPVVLEIEFVRCDAAHRGVVATIVCVEPGVFCLKQIGAGELRRRRIRDGRSFRPVSRRRQRQPRTRCRGCLHRLRRMDPPAASARRAAVSLSREALRGVRRAQWSRTSRPRAAMRRRELTAGGAALSGLPDGVCSRRPELECRGPCRDGGRGGGVDGAASLVAVSRRVRTAPSFPNGIAGAPLTETSKAPASPEWMLTSRVAVNTRFSPGCRKPDVPDLPSVPMRTQARRRAEMATDNGAGVATSEMGRRSWRWSHGGAGVVVPTGAAGEDADAARSIGAGATSSLRMAYVRHGATPRGPADVKRGCAADQQDRRANGHQQAAPATTFRPIGDAVVEAFRAF